MAGSLLRKRARGKQRSDDLSSGRLVTVLEPTKAASEAYRTLRTSLLYAVVDAPPKVIVVTSAGIAEGKSTTCANLGVVLAQADKQTLIVDCDLRTPAMHRIFGLRNVHGVVNVLAGEYDLPEVWQEPLEGLKVITAGALPPNPAELLSSGRFADLVGRARQMFDYVLIDVPPVALVSDPAIVAVQGDGTLLVLDAQNTRKASVRQSVRSLRAVGANLLGTVMNNVNVSEESYGHATKESYGRYQMYVSD
jgi:capsular exopolysaccharide synthesis family protein